MIHALTRWSWAGYCPHPSRPCCASRCAALARALPTHGCTAQRTFTHFALGLGGLVFWQPAHMCKVLEHGDEIIQIDGYDTPTKEAIMPLLRGSDVPGSKVDITVKRV